MPDLVSLETAKALSKPLEKLIEAVQSGVGALTHPLLIVLKAKAEGKAALVREGYAHQIRLLRAKNRAELAAVSPALPALPAAGELSGEEIEVIFEEAGAAEVVAARITETEQQVKRRANVITIAAEAADWMPNEVSDQPVDPDWTARFFTAAQDVSAQHLQHLWGKLLACEVATPGGVPLRTLDILRNLSVEEARMFEEFVACATVDGRYLAMGSALEGLELLQDAGLVQIMGQDEADKIANDRQVEASGVVVELRYSSGHILRVSGKHQFIDLYCYAVTPSARPLLRVVNARTDIRFLREAVKWFNSRPSGELDRRYVDACVIEPEGWTGEHVGEGS